MHQSHYDPDALKSSYQRNYQGKQCELTKYENKYAYTPNTGKFYSETEYKKSYQENPVERRPSVQCVGQYQPNRGRFEGKSTYKSAYEGKQGEQTKYETKYAYTPNSGKFYSETEYKKSYHENPIEVRPSVQCVGQYQPNRGRFEGKSTYKSTFEGRQGERAELRPHYAYQPNKSRFDEHTTYKDEYKRYEVEQERPRTCQAAYHPNPARFDSHTAYKDVTGH